MPQFRFTPRLLCLGAGALGLCLLLGACSRSPGFRRPSPEDTLAAARKLLSDGWESDLSLHVPECDAQAQLLCGAEEQSLTFTEPEGLQGLCFTHSASGVSIQLEGLRRPLPEGSLLESAAASRLFRSVSDLLSPEGEALSPADGASTEEALLLEGADYSLLLDRDSGAPLELSAQGLEVRFLPAE